MTKIAKPQPTNMIPLPVAASEKGDYGCIGRDHEIQALTCVLQQQLQAGLLVHGMAGVGKTTLIQGFLQRLQQTGGLKANIFWFRFNEICNFEYVINQMVEGLFGADVLASPMQLKVDNLCAVFKQNPFILVWDNFESATGIEDNGIMSLLSDDDRHQLKEFLRRLHDGKTKVIITSRSSEAWLSTTECSRLPLDGLQEVDRWQYCDAVVRHYDLTLDRDDGNYKKLMERVAGHPLAMRVILLKLDETPADLLLQAFEQGFDAAEPDELMASTDAAIGLLETSFPPEYTAVLQFIGLHRRYVQLNTLTDMMKNSDLVTGQITIKACITVLEHAGLMHLQKKDIYILHPALNEYLKRHHPAETAVQGAFVDLMGHFADHLAPKEFHVQRAPFFVHSANFHFALSLAESLGMAGHAVALLQALAVFAQNNQDFQGAVRLFESLASHYDRHSDDLGLASCYHQLGMIAQEQRNFAHSEQWYLKSLTIKEKRRDELGIANTCAQIGALQRMQQHWLDAAQWFIKAATIFENSDDTDAAARVAKIYIVLLQESDVQCQNEIKKLWRQSSLEQTVDSLDALIEESNKIKKGYH